MRENTCSQNPTQLLTVAQAAARLSCSTRTIWQLIALNRLAAIKIGTRSTRIDEAEVERFIEDARRRSRS